MKTDYLSSLRFQALHFILLAVLVCVAGCGHDSAPPPHLSMAEVPGALERAFEQAEPKAGESARQVIALLKKPDYSGAYTRLLSLSAQPGLTSEQNNVIASALVTVNEALQQQAQTGGDLVAARTLQHYRATK